ncbi:MAG: polysaccharide biosynthesis protein, partial [Planctomycetota bacterium]|nr:polysaccharide biosynthesis protein [Planctomycetota bacterium]
STDKAANPVNLYGATKLAADKCFVAGNHLAGESGPRFSVVRYGNVVGSRGSVVLYFRELLDKGAKELPITDMRMTRFWITLKQGVAFVLDRLATMAGGEIFIPKVPSMKVADVARALAPGVGLYEIGVRPGEKLHEVLVPSDEARQVLEFPRHFTIEPAFHWWQREDHLVDNGDTGTPVPEDFRYASDTNSEWLSADDLRRFADE